VLSTPSTFTSERKLVGLVAWPERLRVCNASPALLGDVTGNGVVNSGDSLRTRNLSGQLVDSNTFRSDVNIDGAFNSGRNRSGNALP
jgi:hypothetical protein